MGFLVDAGQTFTFEQSKQVQQYIKEQAIIQFLKNYKENIDKHLTHDEIVWGDEIEYQVFNLNKQKKIAKIQLNTKHVFDRFEFPDIQNNLSNGQALENTQQQQQTENNKNISEISFETKFEYGQWMVEAVPRKPYKSFCHLPFVLQSIKQRRIEIQNILSQNDQIFSISNFPMFGVSKDFFIPRQQLLSEYNSPIRGELDAQEAISYDSTQNQSEEQGGMNNSSNQQNGLSDEETKFNKYSQSLFSNDNVITQHRRFKTLTQNIRERRGEKVCIRIPLFQDKNTNLTEATEDEPFPGEIYMDAMAFGMGSSCVQVTFATKNVFHARVLYDQLAILSPLFLALTASSPIFKGKLQQNDTRWDVISQSVDCRTKDERDPNHQKYIPKSRYDSISYFIAPNSHQCIEEEDCGCSFEHMTCLDEYNDLKFPLNQDIIQFIKQKQTEFGLNLDDNLIQHLGFLFIRDALVIFKNKVENIDENSTEHFENIQSTNWNSVRFKPPPQLNHDMPWRVEFRTMEIQLTEEENSLFIFLILKIVKLFYTKGFKLNFYIPISYVDKNFLRSKQYNAILTQKFFFRKNIFDENKPEIIEITLKEFFFGSDNFIGLEKVFYQYMDFIIKQQAEEEKIENNINYVKNCCQEEFQTIFEFVRDRVEGKRLTMAQWMRNFVTSHPLYKQDSIVTQEICYDLLNRISEIQNHIKPDPNFIDTIKFH